MWMFGGCGAEGMLNDTWVYNISKNQWTRIEHAAARCNLLASCCCGGLLRYSPARKSYKIAASADAWIRMER